MNNLVPSRVVLTAAALVSATSALIAAAPGAAGTEKPAARPRIEVCFVLDTTGSMSGLIEGAKQKIWSIANEMISAKPTPEIRLGLIGYRDRGDDYVLKRFDLTADIDAIYGHLQTFRAGGGGDTPESVNEALECAVQKISWTPDREVLKIVFLVGDAPPHMDYAGGPKYPDVCAAAVKKDLIINTVQCGNIPGTDAVWQEIAKRSEGSYAALPQSGNMAVVATPMDAELAELNRKLGTTLVAYGTESERRTVMLKQSASVAAPAGVTADRLHYNYRAGVAVQGEGELLDSLASGKVKLESVKASELPEDLRGLDKEGLQAEIEKRQAQRQELQAQIGRLSQQRAEYIDQERKRLAESGKADSFDDKVASTIRQQAARKGIEYGK